MDRRRAEGGTPIAAILWRRLDRPGHDCARLLEQHSGYRLEGTAVWGESGQPCRLDYRVTCDRRWRTVAAHVAGWLGQASIEVSLAADDSRAWTFNGEPCPSVLGCDDVDLSFTPATNLLPIRRLDLAAGAAATVRAAWLRIPEVALEPLEQSYRRIADSRYAYESDGGAFSAWLDTDDAGFIVHYPDLWVRA